MRQLLVQVPSGKGKEVVAQARRLDGINLARFEAEGPEGGLDVVMVHLSNRHVQSFVDQVSEMEDAHLSFFPQGVLALKPPPEEAPEQVEDVELRSPLEIFLSGVQSVGSWRGFLGYAVAGGVVVWIGLFTGTVYLLVAAMLIAPFAGPAMNVALATAAGDGRLLRQSLLRYGAALVVTVAAALGLSLLLGPEEATAQMVARSQVSAVSVLLPLAAGFAGALHLVQSERDSLVSGAAVGVLVAASLAPPAGLMGMALALGRWDMMGGAAYVLALQLVGINLSGAAVFRLAGLTDDSVRFQRGSKKIFPLGLAFTAVLLAALLTFQFTDPLRLERASLDQRVTTEIGRAFDEIEQVTLVEALARFPRTDIPGQNTILSNVIVQRAPDAGLSDEALQTQVQRQVQQRIREQYPFLTPLVNVTVLAAPE